MQRHEIISTISADIEKVIGCNLFEIRFQPFSVQFIFSNEIRIFVRFNKLFKFTLPHKEEMMFDPCSSLHDVEIESTRFLFLQNLMCETVFLSLDKLEIGFSDKSKLWIEFCDNDFEPFEIIGATGERNEVIAFHYVL